MVIGFAPGPAGPRPPSSPLLVIEARAETIWEHGGFMHFCAADFDTSPEHAASYFAAMNDVQEFMYLAHVAFMLWMLAVFLLLVSWLASRVLQREDWWARVRGIAMLCLLISLVHAFKVCCTLGLDSLIITFWGVVARFFLCTGESLMNSATDLILIAIGSQSVRPLLWLGRAAVVYALVLFPLAILVPLCAAEITLVGFFAPANVSMGLSALAMTIPLFGCAYFALAPTPSLIRKALQEKPGGFRDGLERLIQTVALIVLMILLWASSQMDSTHQIGTQALQFNISMSLLPVAIARRLLRMFPARANLGEQASLMHRRTFGRAVEQPEIVAVAVVALALGFTTFPFVLLATAAAEKDVGEWGALVICITSVDLIYFLGAWLAAEISAAIRWACFEEIVLFKDPAACMMQPNFSIESEGDGFSSYHLAEPDFRGNGIIDRVMCLKNVMQEDYNVAFKVDISSPYAVTPRLCTLKPGESQKLRVVRRAGPISASELLISACTHASAYPLEDRDWASITDCQKRRVALPSGLEPGR